MSEEPELDRLFEARVEFESEGDTSHGESETGLLSPWRAPGGEEGAENGFCSVSPSPLPARSPTQQGKGQARLPLQTPLEGHGEAIHGQ